MTAAVLTVRLLAVLQRLPARAGREDVHRLRTTVRRLEARLVGHPQKIAKALKHLRKEAGRVRDLDVHFALLKPALLPQVSNGRKAVFQLRKILREKRDRHLEALRHAVAETAPLLSEKLPKLAERSAKSADGTQNASARVEFARKQYLRWARNVPDNAERLHRLRIDSKKLRYSMEALEESEQAAELVAALKQVQDAIGSWHDWATLSQLAERKLDSDEAGPLRAVLRARSGREYHKARRTAESVRKRLSGSLTASGTGKTSQRIAFRVE